MEMLQGDWKQHLRPRAVVGYGVKIFLPSPPNYVTRSPGTSYVTCLHGTNRVSARCAVLNPSQVTVQEASLGDAALAQIIVLVNVMIESGIHIHVLRILHRFELIFYEVIV